MKTKNYQNLSLEDRELVDEAERTMENAYNPYSNFYVGAALLTKEGEIFSGSNVENASYGMTICAERAALFKANSERKRTLEKIAIITKGQKFDVEEPSAPCGACRQVIYEFSQISGKNIEIILSNTKKNKIIITTINELLPLAFGPVDLGIEVKKYQ